VMGLEAASPLAIMERGFSVVMAVRHGQSGPVIRRAADVQPGDRLIIRPREGIITARTETTRTEASRTEASG
jgi:exodeoxyribonuclease VII large subunit